MLRKALHFLPVNERINFKTCVLVYKCLNGLAPEYLSSLLEKRKKKPMRLRADYDDLLLETKHPKYKTTERAFSVSGPKLWNNLPRELRRSETLRGFKADLKTLLFTKAFSE